MKNELDTASTQTQLTKDKLLLERLCMESLWKVGALWKAGATFFLLFASCFFLFASCFLHSAFRIG